jgi:hypothetical protein
LVVLFMAAPGGVDRGIIIKHTIFRTFEIIEFSFADGPEKDQPDPGAKAQG